MSIPAEKPVRVVVADDSVVAREMLSQILSSDPGIEVVALATNGEEAVDAVARLRPDLVTMDIHMPRMGGLAATERIMAFTPTPILVVSSSVRGEGVGSAFDALELGALDVMKKPEPRDWAALDHIARDLIRRVKLLARVRVITHVRGRHGAPAHANAERGRAGRRDVVAIGSSTGGPSALMTLFRALPADFAVPVVVAQHIADGFIGGLVDWLDASCAIRVCEASDGVRPEPGTVYVAPTGINVAFVRSTLRFEPLAVGQLYVPSADVLLESVARAFGKQAIGVLLTGMGADGARGLTRLHEAGAATIAQDEGSSIVFGMPKAAIDAGAVDKVLALDEIAPALIELVG
jgi:two-component system, chemotaxis family, protein-glutamate methylesterase/glutaminase